MSVGQEAKKAIENVYGTVYTVGSASNVLCKYNVLETKVFWEEGGHGSKDGVGKVD